MERTSAIANAANASTTKIETHLDHLKIILLSAGEMIFMVPGGGGVKDGIDGAPTIELTPGGSHHFCILMGLPT
jgi:hypothetical protein